MCMSGIRTKLKHHMPSTADVWSIASSVPLCVLTAQVTYLAEQAFPLSADEVEEGIATVGGVAGDQRHRHLRVASV